MTNEEKYFKKIQDKHDTVNRVINEKYERVQYLSKREVIIHLTEALDLLNPSIIKQGFVSFNNDDPLVSYKLDKFIIYKVDITTLKDRRVKVINEILE